MLWEQYVFRRGKDVFDLWDNLFTKREVRILYITGQGFDSRANLVLHSLIEHLSPQTGILSGSRLLLLGLEGYELSEDLQLETKNNGEALESTFSRYGAVEKEVIKMKAEPEDETSSLNFLRGGVGRVLTRLDGYTDIILDVSSLPRVLYMSLITGILRKLLPNKNGTLTANGVNFQVIAAEDASLDALIQSEDPSNELSTIPGFSSGLQMESTKEWPSVWIPVLGEGRTSQLDKIMTAIPEEAEVCPVVPNPSVDPRRGDKLLFEYRMSLFERMQTPKKNVLYASESNPFEVYRQLYNAMDRFKRSLSILGGVKFIVTPLSSKLMTIGACLACFELRPETASESHSIAIPYAEPTKYSAKVSDLRNSKPELATLLLTGIAYE